MSLNVFFEAETYRLAEFKNHMKKMNLTEPKYRSAKLYSL